MKYTSNNIQIILIYPVVLPRQEGTKVVDHPVYCIDVYIYMYSILKKHKTEAPVTHFKLN